MVTEYEPLDWESEEEAGMSAAPQLRRRLSKTDANSIVGGERLRARRPGERDEDDDEDDEDLRDMPIDIDGLIDGLDLDVDEEDIDEDEDEEDEDEEDEDEEDIDEEEHSAALPSASTADAPTQKVFSFSLPFGGLSNFRSNLFRQIKELREDIPNPFNSATSTTTFTSTAAAAESASANPGAKSAANGTELDAELEEFIRVQLERQVSISTTVDAAYFKKFKGTDNARIRAIRQNIQANVAGRVLKKKPQPSLANVFQELAGNIVILGGYRGSVLRETKSNNRAWIPFKAGFRLRKINLLLGPTIDDEINAADLIYPDGMLRNVGPVDISKKLIKKLSANPNVNIKDFGYDWRLSGDVASAHLELFLLDMYRSTLGTPIIVVAHSMGGMLAHSVLQRRPELFRSLIYVGCPSECLNILGPVRFGDSVLFSDKILTPETNFMMRSGFNFLPLSGRVFVDEKTDEYYDLDYFDPDVWVEYNLNPLVAKLRREREQKQRQKEKQKEKDWVGSTTTLVQPAPAPASMAPSSFLIIADMNNLGNKIRSCSPIGKRKTSRASFLSPNRSTMNRSPSAERMGASPSSPSSLGGSSVTTAVSSVNGTDTGDYAILFSQAYEYLKETLARTKAFILALEYDPALEDKYPPLVVVYGNQVPSVRGSLVSSRQDIKDGNYYNFYYGHGDGVIHQKWLMPQKKGFKFFDPDTGEGHIVGKFASGKGHVSLLTDIDAMARAFAALLEAETVWPQRRVDHRKR